MSVSQKWVAFLTNPSRYVFHVAGGLGGEFQTGRSLQFEKSNDRRMSSLYLSIRDRMGVSLPRFGESNEQLTGI